MQSLIRPPVELAVMKGVVVGVEEYTLLRANSGSKKTIRICQESGDPLLAWINAVVPRESKLQAEFPYHMKSNHEQLDGYAGETKMMPYGYVCPTDKYPDIFIEEEKARFIDAFSGLADAEGKYELVLKCHFYQCNAVFKDWDTLQQHLDHHPEHMTSYHHKATNELNRKAHWGGWLKCWTCATPFDKLKDLDEHQDRLGHHRHGMVPRWKRDNAWYDFCHFLPHS